MKLSFAQKKAAIVATMVFIFIGSYWFHTSSFETKQRLSLEKSTEEYQQLWSATLLANTQTVKEYSYIIQSLEAYQQTLLTLKTNPNSDKTLLRERLYSALKPLYSRMGEKGIRQLQFIDSKGQSLLRMHSLEDAGDNLTNARASVHLAEKFQKSVSGFESGKIVSVYRNLFPMMMDNHYLGAFEIGIDLAKFESDFNQLSIDSEMHIILPPEVKEKLLDKYKDNYLSQGFLGNWLLENSSSNFIFNKALVSEEFERVLGNFQAQQTLDSVLSTEKSHASFVTHNGKNYTLGFLPIFNISNELFGYVAIKSTEHSILNDLHNEYYLKLLVTFLALLAITFMLFKHLKNIETMRLSAKVFDTKTAMIITDANGKILRVNRIFSKVTGYSDEEVVGKTPSVLSSGRQTPEFYNEMWQKLRTDGEWNGEIWNRKKDGEEYCEHLSIQTVKDERGKVKYFVGSFYDITTHKHSEEQLSFLSSYDSLTKLVNQDLLRSHLNQSIDLANQNGRYIGFAYMNVNNFRFVNQVYGYEVGNKLLVQISDFLKAHLSEKMILSRVRGDHFAILNLKEQNYSESFFEISELCFKVEEELEKAHFIKGMNFTVSISIGAGAFGNQGFEDGDEVFNYAEHLMSIGRSYKKNHTCLLTNVLQKQLSKSLDIQKQLPIALKHREFELYYQLQCDVDQRPSGLEALIRWNHPDKGLLFPDEFIPIAEKSGFINELGFWVIEEACYVLDKLIHQNNLPSFTMAVNVSAKQIYQELFIHELKNTLDKYSIPPGALKLELTESMVIENMSTAKQIIEQIKSLGVTVSLDDFGTGYSSLMSLKELPFDQIKIDKGFVFEMLNDSKSEALTLSTIHLAEKLGVQIVAEGVETQEHFVFLKKHHCDLFQGYLFSKPVPFKELKYKILSKELTVESSDQANKVA